MGQIMPDRGSPSSLAAAVGPFFKLNVAIGAKQPGRVRVALLQPEEI